MGSKAVNISKKSILIGGGRVEPSSTGSKAVLTEDWRTPLIILALPI